MLEAIKSSYLIQGKCYTHGGHDDDGVTVVNETLSVCTESAAKRRFRQVIEYHGGLRNMHDGRVVYHTIELTLSLDGKIIKQVKRKFEFSLRMERALITKGRGWIEESKWRNRTKSRKLKTGCVEVKTTRSSSSQW